MLKVLEIIVDNQMGKGREVWGETRMINVKVCDL